MTLPIVTIHDNNPVLRQRAREVEDFSDPSFQKLIDDMVPIMYEKDGIGLAAPQVNQSIRLIVTTPDPHNYEYFRQAKHEAIILINPVIIQHSLFKENGDEGCLSVPNLFGSVKRWKSVTITYCDRNGLKKKIKASGLQARVFQHEIDHIDGILFIDKAEKVCKVPQI
ncbi:MAG: peptide deformylase [Patescibacteria group bacterium]